MRAIRLHEFGPPANLVWEEVPDPEPGPGQVRIAVTVAGLHFIDTAIRAGRRMGPMPPLDLPQVPGREVAGTVDALGPGVDAAWLGRRVVAHLGPASGGYAELAVRDVGAVHPLDGVPDAVAVAMIGTGRTAMGILDVAAAGGLGALFVQAARAAGASVVGAAGGPAKAAQVRELGARAVDYTKPDWTDKVGEVTVALDGVGGAIGRGALDALRPAGRLILFGFAAGEPAPLSAGDLFSRGLTVSGALGRPTDQRQLEKRALAAAADGSLVPLITSFPLADAAAAHAAIEGRTAVGKVVLLSGRAARPRS